MARKTRTTLVARALADATGAPYQTCQAAAAALVPLVARRGVGPVTEAAGHALRAAQPKPREWVTSAQVVAAGPPTGSFTCFLGVADVSRLVELLDPGPGEARPPLALYGAPMILRQWGNSAALIVPVDPTEDDLPGPGAETYVHVFLEGGRPPVEYCVVLWQPFLGALRVQAGDDMEFQLPYWETGPGNLDLPPDYDEPGIETLDFFPEGRPRASLVDRLRWRWEVFETSFAEEGDSFVADPLVLPAGLIGWAYRLGGPAEPEQEVYVGELGDREHSRRWWGADTAWAMKVWVAVPEPIEGR